MIYSRSDYEYMSIDADILVNGGIMPVRDLANDGSWKVLRGEDMAFLKEAMHQRYLSDPYFLSRTQTRKIDSSDHARLFGNLMYAGRVVNDPDKFRYNVGETLLRPDHVRCPIYINSIPQFYFDYGTIPNGIAEDEENGKYSLFRYLMSNALHISDPSVTPAMPWDGNYDTLPTTADFHALEADNVRKEFYYMQPLTRCWIGGDRPAILNESGAINAVSEWEFWHGSKQYPPETDSGSVTLNRIVYAIPSKELGGEGFYMYKGGGRYGSLTRNVQGFVGDVNVRLPFPVKGYAIIHVIRGVHYDFGSDFFYEIKYGYWSSGDRQLQGSRDDRHWINVSKNVSEAGGGVLSKAGMLWFADHVFNYPTSLDGVEEDHSYELCPISTYIICDMDCTAETNSLNWNWSPGSST